MSTINVYLYFKGNCENAFNFYKSIFGGEFQFIGRYKDISQEARRNFPYCSDEHIMHVALPISKETILMGADMIDSHNQTTEAKSNFSLYINTENKNEATRLFNALSEEGDIIVPIAEQFWGSYYGLCIDIFGISWKISYSQNDDKKTKRNKT
ncbi:MAG: VOC family protein [Cellulophaga sp.]